MHTCADTDRLQLPTPTGWMMPKGVHEASSRASSSKSPPTKGGTRTVLEGVERQEQETP